MTYQSSRMIAMVVITVLSGCTSTGGKSTAGGDIAVEDRGTTGEGGIQTRGATGTSDFGAYSLDDPASPLSRRVVYFSYDSSEILPEDQDLLAAHASYLASHSGQAVALEGHTDESGSREYNIGLGDRRAQAVRRVFELQGVSSSQLSTISYGEEKPAAEGHSETAWRLNRRVEIVYPGY